MTSKTQRLEMSLSLFKINIDTKSSEPHFCGNMLQLRVSSGPKGGTFPVPIGKTEIKKILASKPAKVVLEFGSKISLDCFDPDAQVRVQLLVDDSVFGTTVIEQKALEDACVSGKSVRKKFRNPEEKIVDSPFVEVKVEAYAALTNAPVIEISELKFVRIIGKGAFGEVWEGDCRASKVAIKKIINTRNDHTALDEFMDEMLLMRDNPHPNLVLLIGVCHDRTKGDIYCVTELLQGDVHQLLIDPAKKKAFSLASIINMAADAASGIAWLHNRTPPILHRDIKPSNFLHNEFNRIKVGDFGLSREITTTNQTDFLTIAGSP
ncbi:MAG: protein kinase, partial [archaeon]|nr:protein kinase [archaeon]